MALYEIDPAAANAVAVAMATHALAARHCRKPHQDCNGACHTEKFGNVTQIIQYSIRKQKSCSEAYVVIEIASTYKTRVLVNPERKFFRKNNALSTGSAIPRVSCPASVSLNLSGLEICYFKKRGEDFE